MLKSSKGGHFPTMPPSSTYWKRCHLNWSKCLLHSPYHTGHHQPGVRSWLKPAAGQMSYCPSLHDWTFPISIAGWTTNCMNIPMVISMFYSHFVLRSNFRALWCLPTYVCIRVVFVPKLVREEWTISTKTPNLVALIGG